MSDHNNHNNQPMSLNRVFKTKLRTHLTIMSLLALLLAACGGSPLNSSLTQVKPSSTNSVFLTLTENRQETYTPIPETPSPSGSITLEPSVSFTPSVTLRPSNTPDPDLIVKRCVEIIENPMAITPLEGVLIVNEYGTEKPAYLLPLKEGELTPLIFGEWDYSFAVAISPNRETLLLDERVTTDPDARRLTLRDANGQFILEVLSKIAWGYDHWLDNEQLVILSDWPEKPYVWWPYMTVILNPFTGKWVEFPTSFEDLYPFEVWGWNYSKTVYDPTLTRVVYPAYGVNQDEAIGDVVLWDIPNEQALARIPAVLYSHPQPEWSPNGEYVLVAGLVEPESKRENYELLLVNREGEVQRLTHFTDQNPIELFSSLTWSPNGRFVAFWTWIVSGTGSIEELAVLEVETGEVVNYCVQGDLTYQKRGSGPVWSPDSQFIAVEQVLEDNVSQVLIIDTVEEKAYKIIDNMALVGWMKTPE